MNILKFPEDKSIESQLDERKAELDELYDNLNKAFALVDKIEEKAATLEAEYNIYFASLCTRFGRSRKRRSRIPRLLIWHWCRCGFRRDYIYPLE